jgi:hypothetical protein
MSTDQFIASLVSSLAWPFAVVCIAVVFRAQLKTLLTERLSHIKAGPVEADFERLRSDVQAELGKPALSATQPDTQDLTDLAKRIPAAAIIEAYIRVEQELREILTRAGKEIPDSDDARPLAHIALDSRLITPESVNAVEGITVMRHLAVHGPRRDVSVRQAQEYVALVNAVLYAIRQNVRSFEASSIA